jgi:hypothetical protein
MRVLTLERSFIGLSNGDQKGKSLRNYPFGAADEPDQDNIALPIAEVALWKKRYLEV